MATDVLSADERSTLEAALAFIDAHYDDDHAKAAAKRARNAQAAARSNRQRRAELLRLRESVAQLETTRDALVAARRRTGVWGNKHRSVQTTRDVVSQRRRAECLARVVAATANAEALRLSEARALNKRLRAALGQQRDVGTALVQVLKTRLDQGCVQDLLRETTFSSPAISASSPVTTDTLRGEVSTHLSAQLKVFVVEATSALKAKASERVLSESRTHAYQHVALGPVVEVDSSFHVPCEIEDGWQYMMSSCRNRVRLLNQRELQYSCEIRPTPDLGVSEKEYVMEFPDATPFGCIPVHGLALFETAITQDWWAYVWTAVVAIRGGDTQVRERGWTAMTRSTVGRCVFHMRYEVYSASETTKTAEAHDMNAQQQQRQRLLVQSLLQKARQDRLNVESSLTARFGSDVTSLFA